MAAQGGTTQHCPAPRAASRRAAHLGSGQTASTSAARGALPAAAAGWWGGRGSAARGKAGGRVGAGPGETPLVQSLQGKGASPTSLSLALWTSLLSRSLSPPLPLYLSLSASTPFLATFVAGHTMGEGEAKREISLL